MRTNRLCYFAGLPVLLKDLDSTRMPTSDDTEKGDAFLRCNLNPDKFCFVKRLCLMAEDTSPFFSELVRRVIPYLDELSVAFADVATKARQFGTR